MSKQKDFKDLFGCDDSDEENLQTGSVHSHDDKKNSKWENTGYPDTKDYGDNFPDKHIKNNSKLKTSEGKRVKSPENHHHHKKKIKINISLESDIVQNTKQGEVNSSGSKNNVIKDGSLQIDDVKKVKLKKTEIGELVVKLLTPAYIERRFESRDTFKTLARNISHALYDKGNIFLIT